MYYNGSMYKSQHFNKGVSKVKKLKPLTKKEVRLVMDIFSRDSKKGAFKFNIQKPKKGGKK